LVEGDPIVILSRGFLLTFTDDIFLSGCSRDRVEL
jgi:hypothetical protein